METQAGEVLRCAEQQAAGLYDFLKKKRICPVHNRQIDLVPGELNLQRFLNLQDGLLRYGERVELNRQIQIAAVVSHLRTANF
jgi:hypothetical protein